MENKNGIGIVLKKPLDTLLDYGFVKEGTQYRFFTGNNGKYGTPIYTIFVGIIGHNKPLKPKMYVSSHNGITLEVICKLYAGGVIGFEKFRDKDLIIAKKKKQIEKLNEQIENLKKEIEEDERN